MNFSKVKLIVTDMDGTLLNSNNEVSPRFFKLFESLKNRKIHFVAASGRQYHSIIDKLDAIKNEITIVAENGGITKQGNETLLVNDLSWDYCLKAIEILRPINNTNIVLCGEKSAYVETTDEKFISIFSNYYSKYTIVEDLTKVTNDQFFKIAAYHYDSSEKYIYPEVEHLNEEMQVIVSGKNWLDISQKNANKGVALKMLQQKFGVTKEETMVFGDYNNDLQMLKLADFSYAMKNAHPKVKEIANFETNSNDNNGVEIILEQLINSL